MTVTINVTREDIKNGWRNNSQFCAVALAIARTLGLVTGYASVSNSIFIYNKDGGRMATPRTPIPVVRFIACFDSGCAVEPFSFELELPDGTVPIPVPAEMKAPVEVKEEVAV